MKQVAIDFTPIGDEEDFYTQFLEKINLSSIDIKRADDLKSLIIEGSILPLRLEWGNMSVEQLDVFDELIEMLEDLEEVVDDFSFTYFLEQFEDDSVEE